MLFALRLKSLVFVWIFYKKRSVSLNERNATTIIHYSFIIFISHNQFRFEWREIDVEESLFSLDFGIYGCC